MRRASRVDGNHGEIALALAKAGASVQSLATLGRGAPDILCGWGAETYLLEIKLELGPDGGSSHRNLNNAQQKWHREWRGRKVAVVRSPEEALRAIGAVR